MSDAPRLARPTRRGFLRALAGLGAGTVPGVAAASAERLPPWEPDAERWDPERHLPLVEWTCIDRPPSDDSEESVGLLVTLGSRDLQALAAVRRGGGDDCEHVARILRRALRGGEPCER